MRLVRHDMPKICSVTFRLLADSFKLALQFFEVFVGKLFKIDQFVSGVFKRANDFIQFQMNGLGVPVLRVLNQKDHQERDDCRGGIDDQLPGVGKMEHRSGQEPDYDYKYSSDKSPGASEGHG